MLSVLGNRLEKPSFPRIAAAILVLCGTFLAMPPRVVAADGSQDGWEVGNRFPELELPSLWQDGRPLSISDFRGRKVLLHVFASW